MSLTTNSALEGSIRDTFQTRKKYVMMGIEKLPAVGISVEIFEKMRSISWMRSRKKSFIG